MLTILAGHCSLSGIPGSTRLWIEALRQCSEHLILVFDNPLPADLPAEWQQASDLTLAFERHGEYDFGSYKRGLALAASHGLLERAKHVLLCNDSVVGPLGPLEPLLAVMTRSTEEAWGLIHSRQGTPHLQSWFLVLGKEVVLHPAVQRFFAGVKKQPSRHAVIETYEFGLSRALLAAGVRLQAWLKAEDCLIRDPQAEVSNPCMYPISLVQQGIPLIKKRALRQGSANAEGLAATCQLIAERNPTLWQSLLRESPHHRLWQDAVDIAILLPPEAWPELDQHLTWRAEQPHRHTRLVLPIDNSSRQRQGQLMREHREALRCGHLQLIPVEGNDGVISQWNRAIDSCQADWIALASPALWRHRLSLKLQAARIVQHLERNCCPGQPPLAQRDWLRNNGGLPTTHTPEQIVADWNRQRP